MHYRGCGGPGFGRWLALSLSTVVQRRADVKPDPEALHDAF